MQSRVRCLRGLLRWICCCQAVAIPTALAQTSQPASAPGSQPTSRPSIPVADAARAARQWIGQPARAEALDGYGPAICIEVRTYEQPKAMRVWIVTVDMTVAGVRAIVTPPATGLVGDDAKFETRCENTLEFAQRTGVQLAINTSAFGPFRPKAGMPMDVVGLAAADGRVYSPHAKNHDAMYVSRDGRITLKPPRAGERDALPSADSQTATTQPAVSQPALDSDVWQVIPGFRMLIDDGRIVVRQKESDSSFGGVNPRTAVATDREGKKLWIAVVDGRQPGASVGMTLVELAVLFESLGAWDALNLDGGGSTTLVAQQPDRTHKVLNTPVGQKTPGSLRQVANNLGFHLPAQK